MNYLCADVSKDYFEDFSLSLLSYILFETPNSPLYKALIESNIAPSFSPGYGYDSSMREGMLKYLLFVYHIFFYIGVGFYFFILY